MGGDMNIDRIKEIQKETGYPDSISVQQALLKVWNECEQEKNTLNKDKVFELFKQYEVSCISTEIIDEICSLSLPTLSEGEITENKLLKSTVDALTIRLNAIKDYFRAKDSKHKPFHTEYHCKKWHIRDLLYGPLKELTKPKEE
jgi:hypothetical protein